MDGNKKKLALDLGMFLLFTGIIISEAALTKMGNSIVADPFWFTIHDISSNLFLLLLGIHLAMHWDWIVKGFKRYILLKPSQQQVNLRQQDQLRKCSNQL